MQEKCAIEQAEQALEITTTVKQFILAPSSLQLPSY